MNYIDFTLADGFPLSEEILGLMQTNYEVLQGIAEGFGSIDNPGDSIAIYGCSTGTTMGSGLLYVNIGGTKELLEFKGGTTKDYFLITGSTEQRKFYDGECKNIIFNKWCELTDTITPYQTVDIQYPKTNIELENIYDSKIATLNEQITLLSGSTVPIGTIVMWSNYGKIGTTPILPTGWELCDGSTGKPDLRGKFIVGYDDRDVDYEDLFLTGGTKEVKLTAEESGVPSHTHDVHVEDSLGPQSAIAAGGNNGVWKLTGDINGGAQDASESHENRPPYYVLAYIIKTS